MSTIWSELIEYCCPLSGDLKENIYTAEVLHVLADPRTTLLIMKKGAPLARLLAIPMQISDVRRFPRQMHH